MWKMESRVNLGDEVEDTITGFKGIAVGVTFWMNGCIRVSIQPKELREKGGMPMTECIDEVQLKVLKQATPGEYAIVEQDSAKKETKRPHGDRPSAPGMPSVNR